MAQEVSIPFIQLFPYGTDPRMDGKHFVFRPVELHLSSTLKIGRKIDGKKAGNSSLQDFWLRFRSKVISRVHAEIFVQSGQVYFKDVGSSSGSFINRLRLSPSGKESNPVALKSGDIIQLGVDYQGREQEVFKCVQIKIFIAWNTSAKPKSSKLKHAIGQLISAMNPNNDDIQDPICCICLSEMEPFQALFLAPCSHSFHFKCCQPLIEYNILFQCPLCRQVANLDAEITTIEEEDSFEAPDEFKTIGRRGEAISDDLAHMHLERDEFESLPLAYEYQSVPMTIQSPAAPIEMHHVDELQRILTEYERGMEELTRAFPGLAQDHWREHVTELRQRYFYS